MENNKAVKPEQSQVTSRENEVISSPPASTPQRTTTKDTNYDNIGSPGFYLMLLYGGLGAWLFGAFFLGALFWGGKTGKVFMILGMIAVVGAQINFWVLFYQVWRFVIHESRNYGLTPSIATPGKAIGFCFIPFFNFYWIFQAFGKFPKDCNALAEAKGSDERMSQGLGIITPIFLLLSIIFSVIPVVGFVTAGVNLLILYPIYISRAVSLCHNLLIIIGKRQAGTRLQAIHF